MIEASGALLTDLYQLTMLQAYFREGMEQEATFELFVRKFPPTRSFLLAAGLEQLLDYLQNLHFKEEDLAWLQGTGFFTPDFLDYLSNFQFKGDLYAMPEGTAFFPNEPIVRVTALLPQAQLVETRLINLIQFQTVIASKAVRSVLAAEGRSLVDFGLRRAHGAEAGLLAARASYLAGFTGTSNVLAAKCFGIPIFGTMAHSYIMAHDDEADAFARFSESLPGNVTLLIDTYDTLEGARKVGNLAATLAKKGISVNWVRIDSGDLGSLARDSRKILDDAGLGGCRIFASGDLDEFAIRQLLRSGAPIDSFGVGTRLVTSEDAPSLNCAYKLEEYAGRPRRKRSKGKDTWPGRKQVFRCFDDRGCMIQDLLTLQGDAEFGEPLLRLVMAKGKPVEPPETLDAMRQRVTDQLQQLPPSLKVLDQPPSAYPVVIGRALQRLVTDMDHVRS